MTAEEKMQLVDWLDDLCVRFIINLPQEELESVERICFQVEEAQWFYEDFIRPLDPSLPSMSLRNFCLRIFQHCPLLSSFSQYHHATAFSEFLAYKTRVPVRGAIMLNEAMDQVVLVKGWKKSAAWSFPRGKINKDERDLDCAIREVYEETGYDLRGAGLVDDDGETKSIEITMREQHMKLFIFRGVPMGTNFEPRTRKEISKIEWYTLSDLPTYKQMKQHQHGHPEEEFKASKFYMVAPFLVPLKKWIGHQRKKDAFNARHSGKQSAKIPAIDAVTEDETAGETSAQEEGPMAQVPSDFERLLSGLRGPRATFVSDSLPEVLDASRSPPDPAGELKRMLSVSSTQPLPQQIPTQDQLTSANLLSILQGNSTAIRPHEPSVLPLQTPAEQINEAPVQPRSPTKLHRTREPPIQTSEPPFFPIETAPQSTVQSTPSAVQNARPTVQNAAPSTVQNPQPDPSLQERLNALHSAVNQQNQMRSPIYPLTNSNVRRESLAFRPAQIAPLTSKAQNQDTMQQTAKPFQLKEHTNSSEWQQFGDVRSPTVPAANKLPLPKLNNHTIGLLNAFKGNNAPPLVSPIEPAASGFGRPSRNLSLDVNNDMFRNVMPATSEPNLTAPPNQIRNSHSPAATVSPPGTTTNGYSSASPMPDRARTTQQNTLLNLFRAPSVPNVQQPVQSGLKSQLMPAEPVELSAAPNTPKTEHPTGQVQILQRPKPSGTTEPKSLNDPTQVEGTPRSAHRHRPSGQISATVSGPLTTPDFGTLQQKGSRASPPKTAGGTEYLRGGLASPGHSQTRSPHAALLKPKLGHHKQIVATSVEKSQDSPQPFQPRILQRPKQPQQLPTSPQPKSPSSAFDRRDSLAQDQRSNLLSLFAKSITKSPAPSTGSSLTSPVEKPYAASNAFPATAFRSRPGSMTSAASVAGNGGAGPARSQVGSDSGGQTPVTPKDRDFLLGYLQGVAKGGKSRA
ncbi:MAG: mRNA-decapping enzyme subunit 2 [Bathelium mastoideum]|nr:MAG: mRNA-decapping enzyme subunit 2 [Bathelium mastoideum]